MVGQRLLHYEITEKLGEGGMGVVYKARDTHLDRFVAIKVLPPERTADPTRKARFVQEAKAASALNHPNIITIYDIGSDNGQDFIAMEFVAGKTLDELTGRRKLKLNACLGYAIQIADALTLAHSAGIIHRDLKPSNLMVGEDGRLKVLDFGLAKLTEFAAGTSPDASTRSLPAYTEEGAIVGTVAYMSPEQAEGKPVDTRTDIFSLGSVLYEMVSGRRAFQGESKMSTLSSVLHKEPEPLPDEVPRELARIVTRCLRKEPARRFQHMDDVKVALQELKEESDSGKLMGPAPARAKRAPYVLIAALSVLAVAAGAWYFLRRPAQPEAAALRVAPLTSYAGLESEPTFSPDGNDVAFTWNGEEGGRNFDIHRKLIGPGQPLRLTTDPARDFSPAWSPDGRWIAFLRQLEGRRASIFVIPALGGPERLLGEVSASGDQFVPRRCLEWFSDGKWLAACDQPAIVLLSVETGEKRRLTAPPAGQVDADPALSPDGRFLAFSRSITWAVSLLYVAELGTDLSPRGGPVRLSPDKMWITAHPVWTCDGQEIVFAWGNRGNLNLWRTLAGRPGRPRQLTSSEEYAYFPTVSRRGDRLVFTRQVADMDIWRMEVSGPHDSVGPPTRLISSTRPDYTPQFSPDGSHVVFASSRSGNTEIWICASDGAGCRQITSFGGPEGGAPHWSPDGTQIVHDSRALGQAEIYVTGAHGGPSRNLTNHPAQDIIPSWSKDGRWIYFTSDRSGRDEVWRMPAQGGEAIQVTRQGGVNPMESVDGTHVYYLRAGGLWKAPSGGGEEVRVLDSVVSYYGFAETAKGIYYIRRPDAKGGSSLWFHRFSTGVSARIADIARQPWGLSVSPDGRWILYSQMDRLESDLMLAENFK